jgi:hypothetical protein
LVVETTETTLLSVLLLQLLVAAVVALVVLALQRMALTVGLAVEVVLLPQEIRQMLAVWELLVKVLTAATAFQQEHPRFVMLAVAVVLVGWGKMRQTLRLVMVVRASKVQYPVRCWGMPVVVVAAQLTIR